MTHKIISSLVFNLFCAFVLNLNAQITSEGKPLYNPVRDTFKVPQIHIDYKPVEEKVVQSTNLLKDNIFAKPVEVNIDIPNRGKWFTKEEAGKEILLLAIEVSHAKALHLILDPFVINEEVSLFLYNEDQSQVLGALTSKNNKISGVLPLSVFHGNKIYCEIQTTIGNHDAGQLLIDIIGVESLESEVVKSPVDRFFGSSDYCNVNVNCDTTLEIQLQKKSVCRIVFAGSTRCTGTLINNLNHDETPYVLTAAHCINTEYLANTAVFYFNYESPDCVSADGPIQSISGASLISAGHHVYEDFDSLDFALLKLSEKPPSDYEVYYSGWDASGSVPDSSYVLHHPWGDVKKISRDSDPPNTGSAGFGFENNTHWHVYDYEMGTTEAGSSGAALISDDNLIVGSLTLGGEACLSFIDDYYQQFHQSYSRYSDWSYQLKHWLDPDNTGKLICPGHDPLAQVKQNEGWGYISGHNYQGNMYFAERKEILGSKYINGVTILPEVAYHTASTGQNVIIYVWEGNEKPENVVYEKTIPVSDFKEGESKYIKFDPSVQVSYNYFIGYQIAYLTDTFAVKFQRTSAEKNTAYTLLNEQWKPLQLDGVDFPCNLFIYEDITDLPVAAYENNDTSKFSEAFIYPNPSRGEFQVYLKHEPEEIEFELFDISGRSMYKDSRTAPGRNVPLTIHQKPGLYFLRIWSVESGSKTYKLIIRE